MSNFEKKRWNAVVVVILKDESKYICDWMIYHLSVGFEHFFVYDNGSSDDLANILKRFICGGVVTLINWPVRAGQIDAYNHAIRLLRGCSDWAGFFDIDEYVVLHNHDNIKSFLADCNADQVIVPWRNFAYSGHKYPPGGTDIENYFWAYKSGPDALVQVKHLVRCEAVRYVTAHFSNVGEGTTILGDGTKMYPAHATIGPTYKNIQINHYATRSYIENLTRIQKGQVDGGAEKQIASYNPLSSEHAAHLEYETSILKHFTQFALERELWRNVAEYPHRFGLMQKGAFLSSWNNIPFFFSKSYANYLEGRHEIAHGTNLDLRYVNDENTEIRLASFWHNADLTSVHFRVEDRGFLPYFMGSIHYGDFSRRFGFEAFFTKRNMEIDGSWTYELNYHTRCIGVIFELECANTVVITATAAENSIAKYPIPPGRHAGLFYHPAYFYYNDKLSLSISGECRVNEIIIGGFP